MMQSRSIALAAAFGVLVSAMLTASPVWATKAKVNDYPTADRVDFVIGCMAANGQGRDIMLRCACQIDSIAATVPYKTYEMAQTALSLQQTGVGGRTNLVRDPPAVKASIETLRRAQAEANLQCP